MEYTFVFLKPDAVQKQLIGKIITRFEDAGLKIMKLKSTHMLKSTAREHYAHISAFPFFEEMIDYICSGMIIVMVLQGENAVIKVREMIGSTCNPAVGTIRYDFGAEGFRNLIHASDSEQTVKEEINRFFGG